MYIILFLFWLLLNGKVTSEIVLLGLAIVAAMGLLEYRLFGYTPKMELRLIRKAPIFCAYAPVLFWEIIKAALVVARDILLRRYVVTPGYLPIRAQDGFWPLPAGKLHHSDPRHHHRAGGRRYLYRSLPG